MEEKVTTVQSESNVTTTIGAHAVSIRRHYKDSSLFMEISQSDDTVTIFKDGVEQNSMSFDKMMKVLSR